jgi:hypothetical protein
MECIGELLEEGQCSGTNQGFSKAEFDHGIREGSFNWIDCMMRVDCLNRLDQVAAQKGEMMLNCWLPAEDDSAKKDSVEGPSKTFDMGHQKVDKNKNKEAQGSKL